MTFGILKYWIGTKFRVLKRLFRALGLIVSSKFGHSPISHKIRGNTVCQFLMRFGSISFSMHRNGWTLKILLLVCMLRCHLIQLMPWKKRQFLKMLTSSKRFWSANSYEIFSLRRVNFLHVLHAFHPQCFGKASITTIKAPNGS